MPRGSVGRDDGNEKRAFLNFAPNLLIPHVPAPQLTLVEIDLNVAGAERRANVLRASPSCEA